MSRGARVGRGATYIFMQSISMVVFGLIYFIVIAHSLTPGEMGVYAILTILTALIQTLGLFALPSASIKYIAQYLAEGSKEKARSLINRVLRIGVITSTAALILLFVSAEWLSTTISGTTANTLVFRLMAFVSFFLILYFQTLGFLQGSQMLGKVALINTGYIALQSAVGIILVLSGWKLVGVVISWLIGMAFGFAACLFLTLTQLGVSEKPHPTKPLIRFSYPLYISLIVGFLASYMDSILLFSYMSARYSLTEAQQQLGIYNVAVRAYVVPTMLSNSIVTALFPQLSELYTQEGVDALKNACKAATRYSVLASFPVIIGLAVLASPIVVLFGGWEYRDAGLPLTVLCLSALPFALGVALGSTLTTLERTKTVSIITIVSIIATSAVAFFNLAYLYPVLGLTGLAWARTVSALVAFGLSAYALKRVFSLTFDKEALWKASAASLFMTAAILLLDVVRQVITSQWRQFLLPPLHWLPLYVVVGAAAYFFALVALKAIKKHDLELIQEYLPRGFKRMVPWLERLARVE